MIPNNQLPPREQAYRVEIWLEIGDEGGFWMARHPDLLSCLGQGDTPGEALASLLEAREMALARLDESLVPPPVVRDYRLDPAEGEWAPYSPPRPAVVASRG